MIVECFLCVTSAPPFPLEFLLYNKLEHVCNRCSLCKGCSQIYIPVLIHIFIVSVFVEEAFHFTQHCFHSQTVLEGDFYEAETRFFPRQIGISHIALKHEQTVLEGDFCEGEIRFSPADWH